jgi:hypothetical protein
MANAKANGIGPLARRELASITPWLYGVGHALPSGFAMVALALWPQPSALWFAAIGGLATFAGGALWKFTVITRAGHMQGFAVPKVPQRGSGARAAPPRLKPI